MISRIIKVDVGVISRRGPKAEADNPYFTRVAGGRVGGGGGGIVRESGPWPPLLKHDVSGGTLSSNSNSSPSMY